MVVSAAAGVISIAAEVLSMRRMGDSIILDWVLLGVLDRRCGCGEVVFCLQV